MTHTNPNAQQVTPHITVKLSEDSQDLVKLLEAQRARLTHFVRKHLKDECLVDDVIQQTHLEAFRNWSGFRGDSKPETWLFGIAFNLVRNFRVKAYVESVRVEPLEEHHYNLTIDENGDPARQYEQLQAMSYLDAAIEGLPARMRQVVSMVLVQGQSYEDAALELHLPIGTVRSRLSRARDLLREQMEAR